MVTVAPEVPEVAVSGEPETRLVVRSKPGWLAWVDRAARQTARNRAGLVEAALTAYARSEGLEPPPSRV